MTKFRLRACAVHRNLIFCSLFLVASQTEGQSTASAPPIEGTTSVVALRPENDTDRCLQGCYNGDCGAGTDNYVSLANLCDERLSQLWVISTQNRRIVNVASGSCLSVASNDVLTLAGCSNASPAQTWSWYANGSLTPVSNPGSFLTACSDGSAGCNSKIMDNIANDGEMMTIAKDTAAAAESWEDAAPNINGSLIQNFWGSGGTANASFTAAVSASSPWCMQRCSSSDCGDASLDAVIVVSSICDERLGQMWYNDTSMIRSRLTDECLTICGLSAAAASDASSGSSSTTSSADTCLGAGSDYYSVEARPCTGNANQTWQWTSTAVGSVLFNTYTNQAVTVCSDLEPWCGFLLLLGFDQSWSARRLTGVQLPSNMSAITPFQTFNGASLTKSQAGQLQTPVSSASGVPPAPEAPSENTASIESFGEPEPVTSAADSGPPPPPPDTSQGTFGVFLPVTDATPAAQ